MSRVCELTGKKSQKGKKITLIWGVKYRSIRHRQPNLRKTTLLVDGEKKQMKISARALKAVKAGKYPNIKLYATADATKSAEKTNTKKSSE